jgi:DNA-binding transcriptional LysR family regulator
MNVHHLELFYYVAKHGGVSAAARQIPYGIQQPAVSAQILQLEGALGVSLFQRRPFQLTPEGQALYEHVQPFFAGLPAFEQRLRGGGEKRLRIATAELVQREYLPELLARMRKRMPHFEFVLSQGRQSEIETMLLAQDVDIGIAMLSDKVAPGLNIRELARVPLVLLVPEPSRIQGASELFGLDRIELPLITLGAREAVPKVFQDELQRRGLDWLPALELSSLDLIVRYVAQGFGVGLGIALPKPKLPAGVRAIPLDDFPAVPFSALWTGRLTPLGEQLLEESRALAVSLLG